MWFWFASNWSQNLRETFELITKHSNRNRVIISDSHLQLKTALFVLTPKSVECVYFLVLLPSNADAIEVAADH